MVYYSEKSAAKRGRRQIHEEKAALIFAAPLVSYLCKKQKHYENRLRKQRKKQKQIDSAVPQSNAE